MLSPISRRLLLVLVTLAGAAFAFGLGTNGTSRPLRKSLGAHPAAAVVGSPSVAASPSAPVLHDIPQRCRRLAAHANLGPAASLGSPIVYRRGSYTAVLFVDKRHDYTYFCDYEPTPYPITDSLEFADGRSAYPTRGDPAPSPDGVDFRQGADFECHFPTEPETPLGDLYGFAGADVAEATFQFAHESSSIRALVERGFYIVSWSYAEWPYQVTVKTKSGKIVRHHVPRSLSSRAGFLEPC